MLRLTIMEYPSLDGLQANRKEKYRQAKREHYLHLETEHLKARLRAQRRRLTETEEEASVRRETHRLAQARYRQANRLMRKTKVWQYRKDKKWKAARDADEAEYDRLMGQGLAADS